MKITRRSALKGSVAALATAGTAGRALAQTAALGPDDLKSTLTPLGGLRAGNEAGTIPAWTGDIIPLPASYQPGTPRPDPFAGEAPLFSITSANLATYQDKLPKGAIYLLQTYSDYRMDVYPTHRTAVAPQYVYDYTYKNATTAQLSADGNNLSGAYGGTPFPIPVNGKQVMWNHILRWTGTTIVDTEGTYQVTSSGEVVERNYATVTTQFPYYFKGREAQFDGTYLITQIVDLAPANMEGNAELVRDQVNPLEEPPRAWAYLLGQRRVRQAPQLQYDTPIDSAGGVIQWDEAAMFTGALDEYDCKLLGKQEMYVPYNSSKTWATPINQVLGPHHVNPDIPRFELHRVWVVEMTLAPGKRNQDARRVAYIDEDSWMILALDIYDANDSLWKYHYAVATICPDIPAFAAGTYFMAYDFHADTYVAFGAYDGGHQSEPVPEYPASYFTPGQLAALAGGN
jgi:hypothetical protein